MDENWEEYDRQQDLDGRVKMYRPEEMVEKYGGWINQTDSPALIFE